LGVIYAAMGKIEDARKVLEQHEEKGIRNLGMADLYFMLGENEKGYEILESLYEDHNFWVIYINLKPLYDRVRSEERFQNLLEKIGLN
jgi:hypothetical protein